MLNPKNIYHIRLGSIDSTNTWAKNHAMTFDQSSLTCITALEQTAGRGRFHKKWLSPKGQNIYASLYFTLPKNCAYLANLGQVISLSSAQVLKSKGFSPQIKWPNDLLLEGKKVGGILAETLSFENRIGIVLGIGINVNMTQDLLAHIDQPATSLAQQSNRAWTLEEVLNPLLEKFLNDLDLLQRKGFEPFQPLYEELLAFRGQEISYSDGKHNYKGTCHSVDKEGRLNLLLPSGKMMTISAGEIGFGEFREN
jgi:BirA family transcriptional regulator, biotin operon repressor / biotin---[acetyl-CoA-carboxylase] ligase